MIYSITAFGLLLVLKCCIFGISSDAVIVYPYAGEILTVSTGLVFNMLVLVGSIKMADHVVKEMMGL